MIRAISRISYFSQNFGKKFVPKHFGIFSEFMPTTSTPYSTQEQDTQQRDYDDEQQDEQRSSAFGKSTQKSTKSTISNQTKAQGDNSNQERIQSNALTNKSSETVIDKGSERKVFKGGEKVAFRDSGDRSADKYNRSTDRDAFKGADRNSTKIGERGTDRVDGSFKNYDKSTHKGADRGADTVSARNRGDDRGSDRIKNKVLDKDSVTVSHNILDFEKDKLVEQILKNDAQGMKQILSEQFGFTGTPQDIINLAQSRIWNDTTLNQHKTVHISSLNRPVREFQTKSFSRPPRQNFSTSKQTEFQQIQDTTPKRVDQSTSVGSGFLNYLKKAKAIDEQTTIDTIKPSSFNYEKKRKPIKNDRDYEEEVGEDQLQSLFKPIVSLRQTNKQGQSSVEDRVPRKKIEEWIKNPEYLTQATLQLNELLQSQDKVQTIEEYFETIDQTENLPFYAQRAFLNQFLNRDQNKFLLFKVFCDPLHAKTAKSNINKVDLTITIENQHGILEKDYRTYLGEYTVFPYELLPQMYNETLNIMLMEDGLYYKKKLFKRLAGHLATYGKSLDDSTLEIICELVQKQKTPMTLIEIITLFLKRDIQMTQTQVFKVINLVKRYKEYDMECDRMLVEAFTRFQWTLDYEIFQPYIESLIDAEESERHMNLYEMLKDATLLGKVQKSDDKHQTVVIPRKDQVMNYVSGYVDALLRRHQIDIAQRVLLDVKSSKFPLNKHFYGQWIQSHAYDLEQAKKILDDYISKFPDQVDDTILSRFCYVVQKNSSKMGEYFNQIATAYIFSFKVALTPDFVHELSITFMYLKDFTSFASLVKIIYDKRLPLNQETRPIWIKIMKKCPDDSQRGQIQAAVEQIFTAPDPNVKTYKNTKKRRDNQSSFNSTLALPGPPQTIQQKVVVQDQSLTTNADSEAEANFQTNAYLEMKEKKRPDMKGTKFTKYISMKSEGTEEDKPKA